MNNNDRFQKHISSYSSVYAIGHSAIANLFDGPVQVEEKIDGSQFSMAIMDGELVCRSKGKIQILDAPDKMFNKAIETAKSLNLHPGWIYRCEYLQKPKHNTLAYSRVPNRHLIVFDIATGLEEYLDWPAKSLEARRLGLECVPLLAKGEISSIDQFKALLDTESCLGGTKVEGVVVKNYAQFAKDKKVAMGKYVSEAFKEKHEKDWKTRNPTSKDILSQIIDTYRTHARWEKAVQHIRDAGDLDNSPRDIGPLIKEIQADVQKECEDEIKDVLFAHYWPNIRRALTGGFPEWYKDRLAEKQFEDLSM